MTTFATLREAQASDPTGFDSGRLACEMTDSGRWMVVPSRPQSGPSRFAGARGFTPWEDDG